MRACSTNVSAFILPAGGPNRVLSNGGDSLSVNSGTNGTYPVGVVSYFSHVLGLKLKFSKFLIFQLSPGGEFHYLY